MKKLSGIVFLISVLLMSACSPKDTVKWSWFNNYGAQEPNVQQQIQKVKEQQKTYAVKETPSRYYYIWENAVVDTVKQPSMVVNGAYIPEHEEMVILNPGGYKMKERRTQASAEFGNAEMSGNSGMLSPGNNTSYGRSDAFVTDNKNSRPIKVRIYDTGVGVERYSTVLRQKVLFMMKKNSIKVATIQNGGTLHVGKKSYILERDGNLIKISYIVEGKINTVYLDPGHVFITKSGFILDIL